MAADQLQIAHNSYKCLITGMSGFGKTTYWLKAMLGMPARVKFVFDHKGEVAVRLGCTPCFNPDELGAAVPTGWVIFNPSQMFEGQQPEAFQFFMDFAFQVSKGMSGRKFFCCDELQQFTGTNQVPREMAMVFEDGRIRGLDALFISSQPNIIHNRIRMQCTEVVCFRTEEPTALAWLIERGFDPGQVSTLEKGEFICRNLIGRQVGGRVF